MRKKAFIFFTCILFAVLMLLRGAGSLLPSFLSSAKSLISTELTDMEKEQETKGAAKAGALSAEELFDHNTSSDFCLDNSGVSIRSIENNSGSLPAGYLDTLTPPPNPKC